MRIRTPSHPELVAPVPQKPDSALFQDHPVTGKRSMRSRECSVEELGAGPAWGPLGTLAMLIRRNREPLLARWREEVRELPSARDLDTPTLDDHIPGKPNFDSSHRVVLG